ncbi:MAG: UvrD-helicase domain-containing protein, partial [Clostridia bacterium]|nr:UvrD-helicase domain-containing protein [Clostridia bacterium]
MADKPKWKPAQELALNQRGRTLLVSAAAGSGKTAVLTQRIVDILANENGDISRLLVVTFTRAAANEMRERIAAALSEAMMLVDGANEQERVKKREHLSRQLMLLGGSNISTIDSFSLDLVKSNFQATDLPPTFRLADEAELDPLRHEVMDETVDAMFESEPDFGKISDIFCSIRQENALSDALLALVTKLDHYAEGIDILLRSANEIEACATDILHTKFGELWKNTLERYAKFGVPLLDRALVLMYNDPNSKKLKDKYEAIYLEIREHCQGVLDGIAAGDYDKIRRESAAPIPAFEHGTPKAEPDFAAIRPLITKFRDAWRENVTPLGAYSAAEVAETAAETAKILRMLHTALRRYSEEYRRIKLTREVMEFSDIARTAYELLVRADAREDDEDIATPLAKEMQKRFDAVYIDEYQDVNAMQDMTFRAISTPFNRFMVGDIKQSIYRFRGAQPAVFAGYLDKFQQIKTLNEGAEVPSKIFMSDCFRCERKIIDFSNTVSGYLFSNHAKSISYTTDDDLHFAKERKPDAPPEEKCRVLVLNRKKRSNDSDSEDKEKSRVLEAKLIACEIAKLLEEKNADGNPRFSPGDIAVLMRSSKLAKPLAKELAARSIPTNDTTQQRFFENPEILCMYSLLAAIDNPFRDIYLTAALRSPFFGFTLEELVQIRHAGDPSTSLYSITKALKNAKEKDIPLPDDVQGKGDPSLSLYEAMQAAAHTDAIPAELKAKINDFLTRFATYRKKAQAQPVDKLIRFLYEDTHVMAFAGYEEKENGTLLRKGNLRRLYEYARTFEAGGFKGLYQFVRYVDSVMKNGTKMSAPDGAANAVSQLTIHHSKGLQYPICFVSGMGGALNSDDLKPALLSDEKLGCATKLCNAGPFSRTDTFFRKVIATKIKQLNREEEMRVLYVALTRAKERLIVTGVIGSRPEELEKDTSLFASPGAELFATAASSPLGWILTALKHH